MRSFISNNPEVTNCVLYPYVFWDGFFTDEELDKLEEYFSSEETGKLTPGAVFGKKGEDAFDDLRKSDVKFVHINDTNQWLFEKINTISVHINNYFYNFDLTGYSHLQYTEYNKKNDHYNFHTDIMYGEDVLNKDKPFILPRKLSFTLVLSDTNAFKGGDLEFDTGGPYIAAEQKRGRIIAFPSFVKHRVTPIKKGIRKSVVWWVLGPKFK